MSFNRRAFIRRSVIVAPAISYSRVLGANDRIRFGSIGTGNRGSYLVREMIKAGSQCVAVCDVYDVRREQARKIVGGEAQMFADHRRVLDLKDVDAVVIATPDHWHGPIAIDACDAGKDVYVEKPMVHYPKDGQAIVRAVRRNRRVLQVGTQLRSLPHYQEARKQVVQAGLLGKVVLARTWYNGNRGYIQPTPPGMEKKPAGLDWDRWLGPGPKVAWNPDIYFSPYKWLHYFGGMTMGIGIHVVDLVHYYLKLTKLVAAVSAGGIYVHDDGRDTPDVVNVILEYPGMSLTLEADAASADPKSPGSNGIELRGRSGILNCQGVPAPGWQYTPAPSSGNAPLKGPFGPSVVEFHLQNWLSCIRTREKPIANEEAAYWSTMACFMGNEAYRTKTRVVWKDTWNLPA